MNDVIDTVVGLRTPEIIQSFPQVWFGQDSGSKEALGLDAEAGKKGVTLEKMIADMDEAGIAKGLLHAPDMGPWGIRVPPEAVARAVEQYPSRLIAGAVGVNPFKGMEGVRELESCVKEYGFKALHFFPHWLGRPANDAIYYPFYAKCVELDIAVFIQIRMPSQGFLRSNGRPEYIEDVATFFPELRLVGLHLGWPWLEEFMGLLIKHPNFYMTTSAYPTSEWEPKFVRFLTTHGQDKVMFGSAMPMQKRGTKRGAERYRCSRA